MNHKPLRITEIREEGRNVKTFLFNEDIDAIPGQFVFAWAPGVSEKPFSLSYLNPLGITVKKLGLLTTALLSLEEEDTVWVRGPYGNGFPIDNLSSPQVYIVGGGMGAAPLALLAERLEENSKVVTFLGAKSPDELIFEKRFRRASEVYVTTENGLKGERGNVTDLLEKYEISKGSKAAVCGKEKMLLKAAQILEESINASDIYLSLERYMKCGRGLCGSCEFGGYRVCMDGPTFSYDQIRAIRDFGHFKRDRAGKKDYEL